MMFTRIVLFVLLFASIHCLRHRSQHLLHRIKRQSSRNGPASLQPPKIPYASLSAGAEVPYRVRNRQRTGTSSSSSSSSSSQTGSTQRSGTANTGAGRYTSGQYGAGSQGYPYGGGGGGGYGQQQQLYGQQTATGGTIGQDGKPGVPVGYSTYPYANAQEAQQGYQSEYQGQSRGGQGGQYSSVPQYGGNMGRGGYPQQTMAYNPMGGYNPYARVGYGYGGGGYPMGANPYAAGGGMYGGMPQMPYMNPYAMQQGGGYYGAGYQSRGYSDAPSIGSPYRDPNSPFTSYVHPNPQSAGSGRYGGRGGSQSYGGSYGGRSGSSYYGQGGSSSYGGSDPYGSSGSQSGYSGSSYYGGGGGTGSSTGGYGGSSYGQSQQSPTGGGSYGQGQSSTGGGTYGQTFGGYTNSGGYGGAEESSSSEYGSQAGGGSTYGSSSSSSSSDPYGRTYGSAYGSASNYGGGSSSSGGESQYGQAGGSQYATSGSRYGYDSSQYGAGASTSGGGGGNYGSYGQSQTYPSQGSGTSNSQSTTGQRGGAGRQQAGAYYNPLSAQSSTGAGSSGSRYSSSYGQQSQYGAQSDTKGGSQSSSRYSSQQTYQTGRFYNPQDSDPSKQGEVPSRASDASDSDGESTSPPPPSVAPSAPTGEQVGPRAVYPDQHGVFLVSSQDRVNSEENREIRREGKKKKPGRKHMHPALRKCQVHPDGLPDLYIDGPKMRSSIIGDIGKLSKLSCAKDEGCLGSSAYTSNPNPYRRLLKFATVVHNGGTADFKPDRHYDDWKFHSCHKHYHSMKEFAHFHLLFKNGTVAAKGHKVSFCLEDSGCRNPCTPKYSCNKTTQGISPGCHDDYLVARDCQWIDVTDVIPGDYTLRVTVNPLVDGIRAVPELSYTNNAMECPVSITMRKAESTGDCTVKR